VSVSGNGSGKKGLVERLLARDELAFVEFADTYGPWIVGFLYRKRVKGADAECLAVTCITEVSLRMAGGNFMEISERSFTAFVFAVVRNCLADWYGHQGPERPLNTATLSVPDEIEPNMTLVLAVDDAFAKLARDDQGIIDWRYFQEFELSFEEIAALLGVTEDATRKRHERAVSRLRTILEADIRIQAQLAKHAKGKTV
jgi:RNA polymerase sigma factor (sigma-70 family)